MSIELSVDEIEAGLTSIFGSRIVAKKNKKLSRSKARTKFSPRTGKINYSVPPVNPWRYDIVNHCERCGSRHYLQRHHVTYEPEILVYLCTPCHKRITSINTRGSQVAYGNKKTRVEYTNGLRRVLWNWFMTSPWPVKEDGTPIRRMSKGRVRRHLKEVGFKIKRLSSKQHQSLLPADKQPGQSHIAAQSNFVSEQIPAGVKA